MTTIADTTPYPWPFDDRLDATRTALVVVGAGRWTAARTPDDEVRRSRLSGLRAWLAGAGVLIVLVDHRPELDRVRTVDHPAPALTLGDDEIGVTSAGLDGFYGSALDSVLHRRGRSDLILCGYGMESAVHSTVRRANDRGYECLTVVDATLPHDEDLMHAARSSIEMSGGIFGAVGASGDVIAAFLPEPPDSTIPTQTHKEPPR